MYSYGLVRFMQAKKLKSTECIDAFLKSEGVHDFVAKNTFRADRYINKNWSKFCSFVDNALKKGEISGQRVRLDYHHDEKRAIITSKREEYSKLTPDEDELISAIKEHDDIVRFSKTTSYISKTHGVNLPQNTDGVSRAAKVLPKIQYIISNGWKDEIIKHIQNDN